MILTIMFQDNKVYLNYKDHEINLSSINFPANFRAFHWDDADGEGEIEFNGKYVPNQIVTSLPDWAIAAKNAWQAQQDWTLQEEARIQAEAETQQASQEVPPEPSL